MDVDFFVHKMCSIYCIAIMRYSLNWWFSYLTLQSHNAIALFSTVESQNPVESESTSGPNNSSDSWISEQFETKSPHQILGSPIPYSDITIGVLKEDYQNENRVSVAPDSVKMLVDAGLNVVVESGGKL